MPGFGRWRRDKAGRLIALDPCPAGPDVLTTKDTKGTKNG
jgi:hypothetical protein